LLCFASHLFILLDLSKIYVENYLLVNISSKMLLKKIRLKLNLNVPLN
jgi:hypothetical protein